MAIADKLVIAKADIQAVYAAGYASGASREITITATSVPNAFFRNCTALISISLPNCTKIDHTAFDGCSNLKSVSLTNALTEIGGMVFTTKGITINFAGTKAEWNAVTKNSMWNMGASNMTIVCSDGTV